MNHKPDKLLVGVVGPTAVGKTNCSIHLAQQFNTEIVSADSRQFYREMSIGTAKPSPAELNSVPHHFIDSHSVDQDYNAFDYEKEASEVIKKLLEKHTLVVLTGGSGLYLHGIWHGFDQIPGNDPIYRKELNILLEEKGIASLQNKLLELDPPSHAQIDLQNPERLIRALEMIHISNQMASDLRKNKPDPRPFKTLLLGLELDRQELYQRIEERVDQMMAQGLLEEVKLLKSKAGKNALKTVGYQELFEYLNGSLTLDKAVEKIKLNSRRYAKRQMTWFRRYPEIQWFHPSDLKGMIETIEKELNTIS